MDDVVKVFWQPDWSSYLKTKEFLKTNNIKSVELSIYNKNY